MKGMLPMLALAAGMLLLLQVGYPLYEFMTQAMRGGLTISTDVQEDEIIIRLEYEITVPLYDARLAVIVDGQEYSASDDVLEKGEYLEVRVPVQINASNVELVIQGVIAGVYDFKLAIDTQGW